MGSRSHKRRYNAAFTLIELIVVTAVIIILTGLVLSTVGYVQKKGARARAETEIAAMSAACESYKADNGIYPRETADANDRYLTIRNVLQLDARPRRSYQQHESRIWREQPISL